jgi:hypothetical protein
MLIQRILRRANVSTMATYHIKTAADDATRAIKKLEEHIPETAQTVLDINGPESQEPPH